MPSGTYIVESKQLHFKTGEEEVDLIDITQELDEFIVISSISHGSLVVFVPGSTASIIFTEYESGLVQDTKDTIRDLIKRGKGYKHDRIDNNAHSHLRSTLYGSSVTIPIVSKKLTLGTWQQVVFADFDVRPRSRKVVLQASGIAAK